jgi:hypothetical protein
MQTDGAATDTFPCIVPTLEVLSNKKTLQELMNSHDWEVDKVEPSGSDGFLVRIHCSRCELTRVFILSDIADSALRAQKFRTQMKEAHDLKS